MDRGARSRSCCFESEVGYLDDAGQVETRVPSSPAMKDTFPVMTAQISDQRALSPLNDLLI
jgi:hypothetical protein